MEGIDWVGVKIHADDVNGGGGRSANGLGGKYGRRVLGFLKI
jgi:hypothetical protein